MFTNKNVDFYPRNQRVKSDLDHDDNGHDDIFDFLLFE